MTASAKTGYRIELDQIQAAVAQDLKPLGFRRRRRTFNRVAAEPGIIHVINFQAGGSYSYLHGQFTVNLGVFLPEVWDALAGRDTPSFIQEYYCEIRTRLGSLAFNQDTWWDLNVNVDQSLTQVRDLVSGLGMAYLDRLSTRAAILKEFRRQRDTQTRHIHVRAALAMAAIWCKEGKRAQAEQIVASECHDLGGKPVSGLILTVCRTLDLSLPFEPQ